MYICASQRWIDTWRKLVWSWYQAQLLNIRLGHIHILKKHRKPTSWVGNQMLFFFPKLGTIFVIW